MTETPSRLHHAPSSSASWRVRIALALKGISYESVFADLGGAGRRSYLTMNPMGQVPCLEIDGIRLTQSVAIIEYLEETRPLPRLLPETPAARARARQIVEIMNSGIQPLHNGAVRRHTERLFKADAAALQAWVEPWMVRGVRSVEAALAATAGEYSLGAALSVVDVFLYPQMSKIREMNLALPESPTIDRVMANLARHPAFVDTAPERVGSA